MKRIIYMLTALCLLSAFTFGCSPEKNDPDSVSPPASSDTAQQTDDVDAETPTDTNQPDIITGDDDSTPANNADGDGELPESVMLSVEREGQREEFEAFKTTTSSDLTMYLYPEFILTTDAGFDILIPSPDSVYLPVSLTIANNTDDLSLAQALDKAKEFYPGVEFGIETEMRDVTGNMTETTVVSGTLDGDWVVCVAMESDGGTVSAWGQGSLETAEGLLALLLTQLGTVIQGE